MRSDGPSSTNNSVIEPGVMRLHPIFESSAFVVSQSLAKFFRFESATALSGCARSPISGFGGSKP